MTMRYCEFCNKAEVAGGELGIVAVLIDDNMETEMCAACIAECNASGELTVEVIDE
jgi:hypothetical protein